MIRPKSEFTLIVIDEIRYPKVGEIYFWKNPKNGIWTGPVSLDADDITNEDWGIPPEDICIYREK